MCLILFAYHQHDEYKMIMAANRDEFYDRKTAPAAFWEDCPQVLGGRDLMQGGSWMGVTRTGRVAAVTNYRDPAKHNPEARSRGELVRGFLCNQTDPSGYLETIHTQSDRYNGFNLLVGDGHNLLYYSNRQKQIIQVAPGIYGLSNHLLDTPWPKVKRGRAGLAEVIRQPEAEWEEALWQLLANQDMPPEDELPTTGVSPEWERILSPVFIAAPGYGTRTSTLLFITYTGAVRFVERTYRPDNASWEKNEYEFAIVEKYN